MFGNTIASPRQLSPQQALALARVHLNSALALKATDVSIMLFLCHDIEDLLLQARKVASHANGNGVRDEVATAYLDLGKILYSQGCHGEAQTSFKTALTLGVQARDIDHLIQSCQTDSIADSIKSASVPESDASVVNPSPNPIGSGRSGRSRVSAAPLAPPTALQAPPTDSTTVPQSIFVGNVRPPAVMFTPPGAGERPNDTDQLACCLGLMQASISSEDILNPAVRKWFQITIADPGEQERLKVIATDVIRACNRGELMDAKTLAEVVNLSPVLDKDDFRHLLREFRLGVSHSRSLDVHQLQGLAQLIQGANHDYLKADDLIKILQLLTTHMKDTHQQSAKQIYKLTLAVSHVLDAMADANVKGLDRKRLHETLSPYVDGLKRSTDAYLVYQAAYAYQALLCISDDKPLWKATQEHTEKAIQCVSGLLIAAKGLEPNEFTERLQPIQQGLGGASEAVRYAETAYDEATPLAEGGQKFMGYLKESSSFALKCAWYPALRGADSLIREGQFATFRKLVCEAPCRRDQAFQWGLCQRLGDVATDTKWDFDTRRSAVAFLGAIYRNDTD
ncbi:hypothetical protein BGX31_007945 [Mortierella sp. GBA43]|nr:hypothetical protein BGX31_007945 [Mortierella sp. GBA43]